MRSQQHSDRKESDPRKHKAMNRTPPGDGMPYSRNASMRIQSAGQTFPSSSSRRQGFKSSSGNVEEMQDRYATIHHWMNIDPTAGAVFSTTRAEGSSSLGATHADFIYYPESPMFVSGDALSQNTMYGSFSTSFSASEPPPMEFSMSSGGATGSSLDFPGSDGSLSGEALSPQFFMPETSSEGDVSYLEMCGLGQTPWSPSTAPAELSLQSGSCSGPLLPPGLMGSPTSFSAAEEFCPKFPNEDTLLTQFTLGASALGEGSYDYIDMSSCNPQIGEDFPPGNQIPLGSLGSYEFRPPTKAFFSNRLTSDGENIKARKHKLYNVGPGSDGLYHCPFASEGCHRKPDKLKCNYDKHMDSHLKPYRCSDPTCLDVPFSSTACLLRHEREAHGLHGHGDRPYSCHFNGCERAVPGNGFPRRWNLQDHMRRVHNYVEAETEAANQETNRSRKKKSSGASSTSTRRSSRTMPCRSRS